MSETQILIVWVLPLLVTLVYMIIEVIRRPDLPVLRKVVWVALMIVVPVVALAIYIVVRPPRPVLPSGGGDVSRAEEFVLLAERRQRGEIDGDRFARDAGEIVSLD